MADEVQSLELALKSSNRGSRYGQLTLGVLDLNKAFAASFYLLAAAQGLDGAQYQLGCMYSSLRSGVAVDYADARRWIQLAAAQGLPAAMHEADTCDNDFDFTLWQFCAKYPLGKAPHR